MKKFFATVIVSALLIVAPVVGASAATKPAKRSVTVSSIVWGPGGGTLPHCPSGTRESVIGGHTYCVPTTPGIR